MPLLERVTKKRKMTASLSLPPSESLPPTEYPAIEDYFCNAKETSTRADFRLHYEYPHEGLTRDYGKSYFIQMSTMVVELENRQDALFFVTNLHRKIVMILVHTQGEMEHIFPDILACHAVNRKVGKQEDFFIAGGLVNGEVKILKLFGGDENFEHVATLNQEKNTCRVNCMTWAPIAKKPLKGGKTTPQSEKQNFYFVGKQQQQKNVPSEQLLVTHLDGYVYFYDFTIKQEEKFDLPKRKSSSRIHQPFIIRRPLKNPIAAWDISNAAINCMEWADSGKTFVAADANGFIYVLDWITENLITTFKTYFGGISTLACRGTSIVSGGEDDLVYVWTWKRDGTSELLCVGQEHESWVSGVALQPAKLTDNTLSFVSVGRNGRVAFWAVNPDTGPPCSPPLQPLTVTGKQIAENPTVIPPPYKLQEDVKASVNEDISETVTAKNGEQVEVISSNLRSLPEDRFLTPYLSIPGDEEPNALFAIALEDDYLCYVNEQDLKVFRTASDDPIMQAGNEKAFVASEDRDGKENAPGIDFQPMQSGNQQIQMEIPSKKDVVVQSKDLELMKKIVEDTEMIVDDYPPLQEVIEPEGYVNIDDVEVMQVDKVIDY